MDAQVLRAQQWLNQNYGDNPLFSGIDEDGITGSFMFSALTEAWQIELRKDNPDLPVTGTFASMTKSLSPSLELLPYNTKRGWMTKQYILQALLSNRPYFRLNTT